MTYNKAGAHREALRYQKQCWAFSKALYGEGHVCTKEAQMLMKKYTQGMVAAAQQQQRLQEKNRKLQQEELKHDTKAQ